jgi:hypothetical protein
VRGFRTKLVERPRFSPLQVGTLLSLPNSYRVA